MKCIWKLTSETQTKKLMFFVNQVECVSSKRLISNSKISDLQFEYMEISDTYIYEGSVDVVCVLLPSFH